VDEQQLAGLEQRLARAAVCAIVHAGGRTQFQARQARTMLDSSASAAIAASTSRAGPRTRLRDRTASNSSALIAGERRWRAARIAGLATMPALVDDVVDDAVSLELALIENIARADLTVIEEARTIASLLDDLNVSRADLARRLGRSRSDLAHTVRLLELPDPTIELIDSGRLTKGHGKALLTEPDHDCRRQLANRAADSDWSVRNLETEIARRAESRPACAIAHADQLDAAATLEDAISRALGIDVQARPHRLGYQLLLDQAARYRLVRLLGVEVSADDRAT